MTDWREVRTDLSTGASGVISKPTRQKITTAGKRARVIAMRTCDAFLAASRAKLGYYWLVAQNLGSQ